MGQRFGSERQILGARERAGVRGQLLRTGRFVLVAIVSCRCQRRANGRDGRQRLLTLLGVRGLLLSPQGCPAEREGADRHDRNVFQCADHFHYGTTIVSPALSNMSCAAFLPLTASL